MTEPTTTPSHSTTSGSNWAAKRGDQWRDQLAAMEAMLAPIDEPLIQALGLERSFRIADLGCGGGGTTLEILRRAPLGSIVHGFDLSPALIEAARLRTQPEQGAVAFVLADVETAPVPELPYDRLLSRLGIMFFDDPPVAFASLSRWLAPGGRFAFAVWGLASDNPWLTVVREVVAEVIPLPPADNDGPGPFRYAETDKLLAILERAGYAELDTLPVRALLPIGGELSVADSAKFALSAFSSFGEQLAAAGDGALRVARESLTRRFSEYQRDGTVRLGACVQIVTGVRSGPR